jgi:hypothetical protein
MALRNLLVRIGADISGLTKGMDNATKKLNKFNNQVGASFKGLNARMGGALAGIGAGFFVKQGVEDAIRYEALMGTLGESMGESVNDFKQWQKEIGASMGFSKLEGADLANTLSLNFKKIATDQKDLVNKTTNMMEMAALVANKRGMAMTEVSDRIRSAMNQEADGADELGVNVRVAAIEQSNAYKMMGATGPWDKLSENMRKTILYHHILEQVGQNLGYTLQDNTQIRLARFNAALGDTRMALGQAFLPIMYTVLPILTSFMRHIERALQYVSAFMRTLFNIKTPFSKTNSSLANQESAALGAADGMKALGDETEKAGKKAKKAAEKAGQGIQSFDQVHLLAEATADSAGGGKDDKGGISPIEPPPMSKTPAPDDTIYDKASEAISKLAKKIREFFKESEGWKTLVFGWDSILQAIEDIADSKALNYLIKNFKEDLPNFFDDLALIGGGALKIIAGALENIAGLLDGDGMKAWKGWGNIISGTYDIFTGTVGLLFPELGRALRVFGDDFDKMWKWVGEEFIEGSTGWGDVFDKVIAKMVETLKLKWDEMRAENKRKFEQMKEDMKKSITDGIVGAFVKYEEFKTNVSNALNFIKNNHSTIWTAVKNIVGEKGKEAYNEFLGAFGPLERHMRDYVFGPIQRAINGLQWGFSGGFTEGLRSIYNKMAHKINGVLGGIAGIGIAGHYPFTGITRYAIPNLAKGGIATAATLAVIGEGKEDEAIAPLSKLQGFVTNAVMEAMQFQGGGAQPTGDIILNLDGRAFARIVKPHLERENKRVGTNVRLNPI